MRNIKRGYIYEQDREIRNIRGSIYEKDREI